MDNDMYCINLIKRIVGLTLFCILFSCNNLSAQSQLLLNIDDPQHGVLLPLVIQDKQYDILLDSSQAFNFLDASLHFKLKTLADSRSQDLTIISSGEEHVEPLDYKLGAYKLRSKQPIIAAHLFFYAKYLGKNVQGTLGVSALRDYSVYINFDKGQFAINEDINTFVNKNDFSKIEIVKNENKLPVVEVAIGNKKIPFLINTLDVLSGRLTKTTIDSLIESGEISDVFFGANVNNNKLSGQRLVRVKEIKIGKLIYRDLLMGESVENSIGLGLLKRNEVAIDFSGEKVFLKKGKKFNSPDSIDKSGVYLIKDNDKLLIAWLDNRGPAARVSIQRNDVIISINGNSVTGKDLWKVRSILEGEIGEKIDLTLLRNEKEIHFSFYLDEDFNRNNT
ncbi:PDZ domain-containing protein [Desulfopila sp. IMCC35008]|uniref:PDZ domain-containing protein n=1 Tax=Desulfopila sp. IMCC35008 TaxID=2653858 RepID=UPI0013CFC652|nr:PDZ domain-containing protein [Desulfopila sp. IMCC35008]